MASVLTTRPWFIRQKRSCTRWTALHNSLTDRAALLHARVYARIRRHSARIRRLSPSKFKHVELSRPAQIIAGIDSSQSRPSAPRSQRADTLLCIMIGRYADVYRRIRSRVYTFTQTQLALYSGDAQTNDKRRHLRRLPAHTRAWSRVKVGNIAHMVWFAHFLFTDSAYIAHAFQCITISFYRTNVNVMRIHGVTNRPKMTTPSIVWWEGRLLFLEVVTHFWVHDPLFLWSKQLLFQFKIYVVACW